MKNKIKEQSIKDKVKIYNKEIENIVKTLKNIYVNVNVSYDINGQFGIDSNADNQIRKIAKLFKGVDSGGGTGFGQRDLTIEFKSYENALLFEKYMKKYKKFKTEQPDFSYSLDNVYDSVENLSQLNPQED